MRQLRIALGQINATVGDLPGNADKIRSYISDAQEAGAQIVAFPELAVSGYPPEDLLQKPAFIRTCREYLEAVAQACKGIIAIIGFPEESDDLYNAAAIVGEGQILGVYRKHYLPNYGVFDEDRYFKPGLQVPVFANPEWTLGVSICEDIWYPAGPHEVQAGHGGAEILVNISASPYHAGKGKIRERMLATRASDNVAVVAFCNMVGGQDELVFDGGSVVFDPRGELLARGRQFKEDLVLADVHLDDVFRQRLLDPRRRKNRPDEHSASVVVRCGDVPRISSKSSSSLICPRQVEPLSEVAEVYEALLLGTRDYVRKNGFQKVVVGLSGGIDSSLVACIAADALGPDNVVGVSMPSRYSSGHSQSDAMQLATALRIDLHTVSIEAAFRAYLELLRPIWGDVKPDLTEENLQSRVRGNILMALSNKFGWLVVTTGNKSENSVGYATLYGDMAGGFAVIKDVNKMLVYELARYRNTRALVIPENVFTKPPSAELRPDQKDSDSLPEYDQLDPILRAYVEENCCVSEIVALGFDLETVRRTVAMVDRAEYKRRQAPPGIKISRRAFGRDRRLPITNAFRENPR